MEVQEEGMEVEEEFDVTLSYSLNSVWFFTSYTPCETPIHLV